MAACTLGSVTLAASGSFEVADQKWVEGGEVKAPFYQRSLPEGDGTNGTGSKQHGFRGRIISINARYTHATEAGAIAAAMADQDTLAAATPFSCTIAGVSVPACLLDAEASSVDLGGFKSTTGVFWCNCRFVIKQIRLS